MRIPPAPDRLPRLCISLPAHWAAGMGGSEYQAKLLVEHLLREYEVEVSYLTAAAAADYRAQGYRLVTCPGPRRLRRYGTFFDAPGFYRALVALRPDIIYQQVGCAHTGIAAWYARRHGSRMVWRVSSDRQVQPAPIAWWRPHHRFERRLLEYGIRNADLVLAQTQTQRSSLRAEYGCTNVVVLPNFHPPAPARSAARGSRKRVVWIANLKRLKNPLAFVRLAERFRARDDVEFVAAGAVQERTVGAEVEAASRGLDNFRFVGALSQAECDALLEGAALLVNTSDFEGFPNTFIQAWQRGVPVASLHVDPEQLLSRGGLGFVAGSEERLHDLVERFLADRAGAGTAAETIAARCRAYAAERHSMANVDRLAALLGLRPRAALPEPAPLLMGEGGA